MGTDERRTVERQIACYPAEVENAAGNRELALIRDVSVTGALLFLRRRPNEGDPVRLQLHLGAEGEPGIDAAGSIVRVLMRDSGSRDLWRYSAAVHFDAPLDAYRAEIEALAERLPPVPVGKP